MTKIEYAFKSLKSDLGMRPVYHQLADRTKGHLLIGVLAYHLLISIEHQLREAGDHRSWSAIKEQLSTHQRSTVMLTDEDDQIHHIRVSGMPEANHKEIYKKLGVKDPLKKECRIVGKRAIDQYETSSSGCASYDWINSMAKSFLLLKWNPWSSHYLSRK